MSQNNSDVVLRLSIPFPWDNLILVPTALLFVLQLALGLPWWVFLLPVAADVAFTVLALVVLNVVVFVHNRRFRRRVFALRAHK